MHVDLRSDLALHSNWQLQGSALIRIAGRRRPRNRLNRTVTYGGRTCNVRKTIGSEADMTVAFAGYRYDVVSQAAGHLGLRIDGQYVDASGVLVSTSTGIEAGSGCRLDSHLPGSNGAFGSSRDGSMPTASSREWRSAATATSCRVVELRVRA